MGHRINRKHVDFVLCDPASLQPRCAIELDDASHQRPDRAERDAFVEAVFAGARLPLLRLPARRAYAAQELTARLQAVLQPGAAPPRAAAPSPGEAPVPTCPKCGSPMLLRTAQHGREPGRQFYGCPNFPRCRQVRPASAAGDKHANPHFNLSG